MTPFAFDNFRKFLQVFIEEHKAAQRGFSLRNFSQRCGFSSHSFLVHVIQGEKNLRLDSVERMLPILGLKGKEATYFRALVLYNQSATAVDRDRYLKELNHLRATSSYAKVREDQWAYYSQWYLPVLREIAATSTWKGDFGKLGKLVRPSISAREASEGVDLLVRIGLLKKKAGNQYALQDQVVSAEGVPGVVFRSVRSEYMLRALEACETLPKEERHASYVVLGTSRAALDQISQKLDDFRRELLNTYSQNAPVECVLAVNLQAFPVSEWIHPKEPSK